MPEKKNNNRITLKTAMPISMVILIGGLIFGLNHRISAGERRNAILLEKVNYIEKTVEKMDKKVEWMSQHLRNEKDE